MRILFAGSELAPFAGRGGPAESLAALPAALAARGHEVSVVVPAYRALREESSLEVRATGVEFMVPLGSQRLPAQILEATGPDGVQLFLVRQDEFFDRPGLAGGDGVPYPDNAQRFIFFSKAVVELARRVLPAPEIVHVHDWPAALVTVLIKERRLPFRSVLSLHDPAAQGSFWAIDFGLTNLPGDYFSARGVEFFGQLNLLKGGILCADQIIALSARDAQNLQTPAHGAGLDAVFREHAGKLTGIRDGVDDRVWNPGTDPLLPKKYSATDLSGKTACRASLLEACALPPEPQGPVFALATQLTDPADLALLVPLLDRLLSADVRLVLFGPTPAPFAREFGIARRRHAERLAFLPAADPGGAHLLIAGADILLLPSHREPGGLGARAALKYGTPAIVQATAGLDEIIHDCDAATGYGNGLVFHGASPEALWDTVARALQLFADRDAWNALAGRALATDVSWVRAAERHEMVDRQILARRS